MKRFAIVVVAVACAFMVFGCSQKKPMKSGAKADLKVIHFDFDKSNIRSDAEPILKDNAKWLTSNAGTKVTVEGHCDERGSVEYNIALGDRRANSAKNYMKNLGVAEGRMSTISYGKERPVCKEHNEKCWWQNRRDEFVAR
jgi:peptidoglycan-associated lipoprotein